MQTTTSPVVPGVPQKTLDNPSNPKRPHGADAETLAALLAQLPERFEVNPLATFPLLDSVGALGSPGRELMRGLLLIGAEIHPWADERRTAEYLLRNRLAVSTGYRTAQQLIDAARCAAEMDVRRSHARETPMPADSLCLRVQGQVDARLGDPSVGEVVIDKLRIATGFAFPNEITLERVADGVAVATELGERHLLNGGIAPSLIAMRANAREASRLVTHLRREFDNEVAARRIARLLVGSEDTSIETAFLWWSARPSAELASVRQELRARWTRDVRAADRALAATACENGVNNAIRSGVSRQSRQTPSLWSGLCSTPPQGVAR